LAHPVYCIGADSWTVDTDRDGQLSKS